MPLPRTLALATLFGISSAAACRAQDQGTPDSLIIAAKTGPSFTVKPAPVKASEAALLNGRFYIGPLGKIGRRHLVTLPPEQFRQVTTQADKRALLQETVSQIGVVCPDTMAATGVFDAYQINRGRVIGASAHLVGRTSQENVKHAFAAFRAGTEEARNEALSQLAELKISNLKKELDALPVNVMNGSIWETGPNGERRRKTLLDKTP